MANESIAQTKSPETPVVGEGVPLIDLTDAAAAEVKRLMAQENQPDHLLRVGVVGGGWSGLNYEVNFDDKTGKFDRILEVKGVRVVVDLKSALYIKGMVIDYVPAMVGGGFRFQNPNAGKSCGCGTSFSV